MGLAYKQLAQKRENSSNAVSVYSPAADTETIIKTIVLTNTTTSDVTFRLFMDDDGTTYDESTTLAWDMPLDANSVVQFDGDYLMNNSAGNFAYRSFLANAITITLFGLEKT